MGRILAASLLLLLGIGLVTSGAEENQLHWIFAGWFALWFVPALIIDEARRRR